MLESELEKTLLLSTLEQNPSPLMGMGRGQSTLPARAGQVIQSLQTQSENRRESTTEQELHR